MDIIQIAAYAGIGLAFILVAIAIGQRIGGMFKMKGGLRMPQFGGREPKGTTTTVTREYEVSERELLEALNITGKPDTVEYKDGKLRIKVIEK